MVGSNKRSLRSCNIHLIVLLFSRGFEGSSNNKITKAKGIKQEEFREEDSDIVIKGVVKECDEDLPPHK